MCIIRVYSTVYSYYSCNCTVFSLSKIVIVTSCPLAGSKPGSNSIKSGSDGSYVVCLTLDVVVACGCLVANLFVQRSATSCHVGSATKTFASRAILQNDSRTSQTGAHV